MATTTKAKTSTMTSTTTMTRTKMSTWGGGEPGSVDTQSHGTVPAYLAIVVITLGTGVQAQGSWFPITVVVTIFAIRISFLVTK